MAPEFSAAPTVSAGYARALFELAVGTGADAKALAEQSGVSPAQLEDPDARIPFARFKALMRTAKVLCGDPALALRFGASSPMQKMSIVGLAAYAAETVEEALAQLNRYGRLIVEAEGLHGGDRFVVVRRGGETCWRIAGATTSRSSPRAPGPASSASSPSTIRTSPM